MCIADQAPTPGQSGWGEEWTSNTCIMYATGSLYNIWSCDTAHLFTPLLANNTFYLPEGYTATFNCDVNGKTQALTLEQWQSYGMDLGSRVLPAPDVQTIIQWGREMLAHPATN